MSGLKDPTIEHWQLRGLLGQQLSWLLVSAIWTGVGLLFAPMTERVQPLFVTITIAGVIGLVVTFRALRRTWKRMKYLEDLIP